MQVNKLVWLAKGKMYYMLCILIANQYNYNYLQVEFYYK